MKDCSVRVAFFDRHVAAMRDDDFLHERETDAVAARLRCEEWNEYSLKIRGRNAASGVANSNVRVSGIGSGLHTSGDQYQLAGRLRIDRFGCVAKQIDKNAAQQRFVAA